MSNAIAKRGDPAFRLRLPKKVLKAINARAKENGRSRNSEIVVVLAQVLGLRDEQGKAPDQESR